MKDSLYLSVTYKLLETHVLTIYQQDFPTWMITGVNLTADLTAASKHSVPERYLQTIRDSRANNSLI